ncbi:MAG: N-acetyltransferase family protein [Bdellovibrionales bacterium]
MEQVRLATTADLPAFARHYQRAGLESGRDGDIVFSPNEEPWNIPFEKFASRQTEQWARAVTECDWERAWILTDEKEVFGECQLVHRPPLKSCLHRTTLMMGIERSHRGKGWGSKMVATAIEWARTQPSLSWIDLFVFSNNEAAQALYKKFGFTEVGRHADMFRVFGQKITDIAMVLSLR